jgi:iduronate 2-sulfatase
MKVALRYTLRAVLGVFLASGVATAQQTTKPNIVIILSDDQGYGDAGFNPHHPKEVQTPHLDALAREGVIFTQGYTSGHVCSPTRAGLMTGRYQQRFGVYTAGEGGSGLPLSETLLPQYLKSAGYVSGAFGKWHMGLTPEYNAVNRGFDEFYGFMGRGAHDYFDLALSDHPIYRGTTPISDEGYLTTRITEEAVSFIQRHKAQPFLLYVAYNAVHFPAQAPAEDIQPHTGDERRDMLMAMLKHLDLGVGEIVATLKAEGLFDNTLLFYLSDNGGAKVMKANNAPLRGFKQEDYEGGIRVPFVVTWPEQLQARTRCDVPVISIDIVPTALAAAQIDPNQAAKFDGGDLLPIAQGKRTNHQEAMYWSSGGDSGKWAVRKGRWKLVAVKDTLGLFDLDSDPGELNDLAGEHPDVVVRLEKSYSQWLSEMAEPVSGQPKRWSEAYENSSKRQARRKRREAKQQRKRAGESNKRPNVLFIVCDDLNIHVSTSGYERIQTPSFDRLADAGMRFSRAYCQYPVCNPSRSSFLNGLYPDTTGVISNKVDVRDTAPEAVSLPRLFKEQGYWTGGVGKVFHKGMNQDGLAWHAFDAFENEMNPVEVTARKAFEAEHGSIELPKNQAVWRANLNDITTKKAGQTPPGYGPTTMTDAQHKDGKNVRRIGQWLDERAYGDKPFFMVCGIQKPHVPFWAPQKYFDQYPKDDLRFPLPPADDWDDIPSRAMVQRFKAFGFELGKENDALRREYTQAYHACVSFIDAQIGMLFDALQRNGQWDNTIIVLTSDHGYQLGEHFMWGKVTLFEECARVPMVVRVPGMTAPGSDARGLVELVDLYPTLAELCDLKFPDLVQGESFVQQLCDPEAAGKPYAYTVVSRGPVMGRSIRTERWRYAEWGDAEHAELYDLESDPSEYTNLISHEAHQERRAALRALLQEAIQKASRDNSTDPT